MLSGRSAAPTRLCPATTIFGASAATASRLAIHASRFCSFGLEHQYVNAVVDDVAAHYSVERRDMQKCGVLGIALTHRDDPQNLASERELGLGHYLRHDT